MSCPGQGETSTETKAVVFADLGDSARLYEQLGDLRAHQVAIGYLDQLEAVVREFGGETIKHIGDEVMCAFPNADDAVAAACKMQEQVTASANEMGLTIHIGVHWGPVLLEDGDVFGDAVNLAARIVGLAHARQILTTRATVEMLGPKLRGSTRLIDRRHVKGKQADVEVYEVVWEHSGNRTEFRRISPERPHVAELRIIMGELELRAGNDKPSVTIGRDAGNDLILLDKTASRRHAKIERLRDRWVLTDYSINGTVVAPDDGSSVLVHNEQILLPAKGSLGVVGDREQAVDEMPVHFEQQFPST